MNVLITGANRGLGYELAAESISRGHHVVALVRNEAASEQLSASLQAGGLNEQQITIMLADVRDEAAIEKAAQQLKQEGMRLNCIINSAAVLVGRQTAIEDLDMNDMQLSFDVNLFGPIRVVKHMLELLDAKDGSILNISSEAGSIHNAYAGDYPYSLSKCALNLLSEQLNRMLSSKGIDVWSIHPGWMRTDMGGSAAPLSPQQSAVSIIDIMERKVTVDSSFSFIDYRGAAMDI